MRGFAVLERSQCTGAVSGLREIDAAPLGLMRKIYRKSLLPRGFLPREAAEGNHAKHGGGGMRARGNRRELRPLRLALLATSPATRGRSRTTEQANEGCSTLTGNPPE